MNEKQQQKKIRTEIMDFDSKLGLYDEPLISAKAWFDKHKKGSTINVVNFMDRYANYHNNWHLNNIKDVIVEKSKVYCFVDKSGFIDAIIDKKSIKEAIDNYIKENV